MTSQDIVNIIMTDYYVFFNFCSLHVKHRVFIIKTKWKSIGGKCLWKKIRIQNGRNPGMMNILNGYVDMRTLMVEDYIGGRINIVQMKSGQT